ncbi:TnpV protein [Fumia xinanensis]|uniref:TnpV protein n=1 Tax=Fumia xinanensis TaxID=2763659 RepID=A0A926E5S0_9FIRM|nr:TnpV protein [Fumia xinanensis]MBC8560782.1 TnpV protein [Fumia xinanensis]
MDSNLSLSYTEKDGILYPNIQISNDPKADQPLGRYGRMALEYLMENHPNRYTALKMDGSLMETMHRVQTEASNEIEALTQQMLQDDPMPQTEDTMERTRHLNSLKHSAEETVLSEIVLIPR